MKYKFLSVFLLLSMFGLSACNTVKGLGQDLQQGGKQLQDAASDKN